VTKPTTINAITDMPAKIPRPIGSTEIFFPGIWKADSAVEDGEEEALSATVTGDVPLLDVDLDFGEIAPVIDGKVGDEVVVGVESGVEVGSGTVESPSADTPGSIELVDVVADEDGEERETDDKDVEAMELVDAVSELLGGWEPGGWSRVTQTPESFREISSIACCWRCYLTPHAIGRPNTQ